MIVGATYEAVGPAHGSKLGPPARTTVVAELEDGRGWRTEGPPRAPANVILAQAARYWRQVTA